MNIGILGAGSWGTTLAILLRKKGFKVKAWDIEEQVQILSKKRENPKLPGIFIPQEIEFTSSLKELIKGIEILVIALPSHEVRGVAKRLAKLSIKVNFIVSVVKGIENETLKRMSEVLTEELSSKIKKKIAVLSGPSHAEEVSRGIPTTVVVSASNLKVAQYIQNVFITSRFRVYTNPDLVGVELGGALKNIIAIAAGISDGLGFGDNTKSALITRGLVEITRLGVTMGANPLTFAGLSGMGDLITTCISKYSRNRNLGEIMVQREGLKEVLKKVGMVAEGVRTTKSACSLAHKFKIEMPITQEVYTVLFENKNPQEAVENLMLRGAKPELEEDFLKLSRR